MTTRRAELEALVARSETATEGSEDLDVAITRAIYGYREDVWYTAKFSRSVDAALTLVPEGWFTSYVEETPLQDGKSGWQWTLADSGSLNTAHGDGLSAPLALAACALRARIAATPEGE